MRTVKYFIIEESDKGVEIYRKYDYREAKETMQQMKREHPDRDYRIEMR